MILPLATAGLLLSSCSTLEEPDLNAGLDPASTVAAESQVTDAETTVPDSEAGTEARANDTDEGESGSAVTEETQDRGSNGPMPAEVTKGTICGDITVSNGELTRSVVALEDGADCKQIMSVFEDYLSPDPTGGPPMSTSAVWEAPNGWFCSKKIHLNGDPENNASLQRACGPSREHRLGAWIDEERIPDLP